MGARARAGRRSAGLSERAILSAVKIYMAVKAELDQDPDILAVGINCLNESMYSDTTPCLAWNFLYEDQRMVWGCEADLVSMMTKILIDKTIGVPFMMTNLYPFEMGDAALKHEHIPHFPAVDGQPEDYILAAHCGFLGVVPQSFSTEWKLKPKVLAIVDDNATAIDARLPQGRDHPGQAHAALRSLVDRGGRAAQVRRLQELPLPEWGGHPGAERQAPGGRPGLAPLHHHDRSQPEDLATVSKVFDLECVDELGPSRLWRRLALRPLRYSRRSCGSFDADAT